MDENITTTLTPSTESKWSQLIGAITIVLSAYGLFVLLQKQVKVVKRHLPHRKPKTEK